MAKLNLNLTYYKKLYKHFLSLTILNFISVFCCVANTQNTISKDIPKNTIWIEKSNSAISCQVQKGIDLETMALELSKSGIKIFAKQKKYDPHPRIQSCGIDQGITNTFLISIFMLEKAIALGFKPMHQVSQTGKGE